MKEFILSEMSSVVEPFEVHDPLPAGGAADAALSEEITGQGLKGNEADALDLGRSIIFIRGLCRG